jgi:hypothetical protein
MTALLSRAPSLPTVYARVGRMSTPGSRSPSWGIPGAGPVTANNGRKLPVNDQVSQSTRWALRSFRVGRVCSWVD